MDARLRAMKLGIILASVREGRAGEPVARWFLETAQSHGGFEAALVDLAQVDLPLVDEPEHPRLQKYTHEHTKRWSAIVASYDAYVAVTPEYNYGAPPSLINAFDSVYVEWNYKPFGFVSYGGVSGGTRSVQMSKQIVTTLKMMPMMEQVTIPFVAAHIKDGVFAPNDALQKQASTLLDELHRWASALAAMRTDSA